MARPASPGVCLLFFVQNLPGAWQTPSGWSPCTAQGPGHPDEIGFVPYVETEHVHYHDSGNWPTNADGLGYALQRIVPQEYGNDPINWSAATPTPGRGQIITIAQFSKTGASGPVVFGFNAQAGNTYSAQYRNSFKTGAWTSFATYAATPTNRSQLVTNIVSGVTNRFYRVVSPSLP